LTLPRATISPAARRDLDGHILWLRAEADAETAIRCARAAIDTFGKLAGSPNIGPPVPSINRRLANIRKWKINGFPKMLIFYLPSKEGVEIIRVLHAAQDWWALLDVD
jgi:toxin ParE1/3/4